jgi:hypothetical protein
MSIVWLTVIEEVTTVFSSYKIMLLSLEESYRYASIVITGEGVIMYGRVHIIGKAYTVGVIDSVIDSL